MFTVKLTVLAPAGTTIESGTLVLLGSAVTSETVWPDDPAAPLRVIVAVTEFPPVTDVEESFSDLIVETKIRMLVDALEEFHVPVIVAFVSAVTFLAVTLKLAPVWPDGTVTDAATVMLELLELKFTLIPELGAGDDKST